MTQVDLSRVGLEPAAPKTVVLPLHHRSVNINRKNIHNYGLLYN